MHKVTMDSNREQQYCLRWNNYQLTVQSVFHKLYTAGKFTDVSLSVDGRTFMCHKVVLSACSAYFDNLLTEHGSHPHPLLVFHDLPANIVEALINFMYLGEVNVNHDDLGTLLNVADSFKIKGLADSAAVTNFSRMRMKNSPPVSDNAYSNTTYSSMSLGHKGLPLTQLPTNVIPRSRHINMHVHPQYNKCEELMQAAELARQQLLNASGKRPSAYQTNTSKPYKKRCKVEEEGTTSLPPSPPASLNESPQSDVPQHSPEATVPTVDVKIEAGEETDGELQIDESVGQTPSEGTESDTQSLRGSSEANSPEPAEEEQRSIIESPTVVDQRTPAPQQRPNSSTGNSCAKDRNNCTTNHKCCERQYTHKDLEDGIEAVISGELTPARAISQFKIPRRTFFRRLSAVRKSRGIPSAKENASEYNLKAVHYKRANGTPNGQAQSPSPKGCLILPASTSMTLENPPQQEQYHPSIRIKEENMEGNDEDDKNSLKISDPNSYFNMLKLPPNYEAYINYLQLLSRSNTEGTTTTPRKDSFQTTLKVPTSMKDTVKAAVDKPYNMSADISDKALSLVTHATSSN